MPAFRTLPPDIIKRMLYGERDVLTPLQETRQQRRMTTPCERCGGAMHAHLDPSYAFSPNDPLPRQLHVCIDANTGIVLKIGNPAQVEPSLPIIRPRDD
jgi:hypothetical protein